jgi:hypothetical protein
MGEYRIVSYDADSNGYQLLRDTLGARGIRSSGSSYEYVPGDIVLNWGLYGARPYPISFNQFEAVGICTSKQRSYAAFKKHNVPTVDVTKSRDTASRWLLAGHKVYARSQDSGCLGAGITVCKPGQRTDLPNVEFYTKGFPATREFRIYVYNQVVIGVYEKKEPRGKVLDHDVRASDDWLYCTIGLQPYPPALLLGAIGATLAVGLDFAGVDIALDNGDNVCVYEVNSAPWLNETIVGKLVPLFKRKHPL